MNDIVISFLTVAALSALVAQELSREEEAAPYGFSFGKITLSGFFGVSLFWLVEVFFTLRGDVVPLACFAGLASMGAYIDRKGAFAPFAILFALASLAGWISFGWIGIVFGGLGYAALIGISELSFRFPRFPLRMPPADALAMALPALLFGIEPPSLAAYLTISLWLFLALKVEAVRNMTSPKSTIEDAMGIYGEDQNQKGITLLTVILPVTAIVAVAATSTLGV